MSSEPTKQKEDEHSSQKESPAARVRGDMSDDE